jgi:enamine deaminase RidA (YjgF/YER057c/UK114 family)
VANVINAATAKDEADRDASVAVLPVDNFEQHGDFLPLGPGMALFPTGPGWVQARLDAGMETNAHEGRSREPDALVLWRIPSARPEFLSRYDAETSRRSRSPAQERTCERSNVVKRTPINPWNWSLRFGFNQAELLEGHTRQLICAGQTAVDAEGAPQHAGNMGAQLALALDNLEAVLAGAGMTLANVVRLNFYTIDVEAFLEHASVLGERLGAAGVMPPGTLLGVARLAFPDLLVELEATAAD